MTAIHTKATEVQSVVRSAFPEFTGRRLSVEAFNGPMTLRSYWDSGSRDYWAFLNLATMRAKQVPECGSPFSVPAFRVGRLPDNIVLVQWHRGRVESVTVHVAPANLQGMLPPIPAVSRDEEIVLVCTRAFKSSYAGVKDYRYRQASEELGMSREAWDAAKAACISKGLLNKAGAITDAGANVVGWKNLYEFKG